MPENRFLNTKEASCFLNISEKQLNELVKDEKLTAYQIGGTYLRFKLEQLEDFKRTLEKSTQRKSLAFERVKDFFYFNDFYIAAILLITFLLLIILKNIS